MLDGFAYTEIAAIAGEPAGRHHTGEMISDGERSRVVRRPTRRCDWRQAGQGASPGLSRRKMARRRCSGKRVRPDSETR